MTPEQARAILDKTSEWAMNFIRKNGHAQAHFQAHPDFWKAFKSAVSMPPDTPALTLHGFPIKNNIWLDPDRLCFVANKVPVTVYLLPTKTIIHATKRPRYAGRSNPHLN